MPKYKLRLPSAGDYLYSDGDVWFIGDSAADAHEFFAEEWNDPTEWVHPVILAGHVLYKADVENGDGHDDAEPGDSTFSIVTQDSEVALTRELRPHEVRAWLTGAPRPWWSYGPNYGDPDATYHAEVAKKSIGDKFESREAARAAVEKATAEREEAWKAAHPAMYRPLPEDDDG